MRRPGAPVWFALLFVSIGCSGSSSSSIVAGDASSGSIAGIESVVPVDGAEDVPVDQLVTVVFTRPMQARSFNKQSFRLERNGEAVEATVAALGRRASIRPDDELRRGESYEVVVTREIRDSEGRPLGAEQRFRFQTKPLGEFEITKIVPGNGARNIARDVEIEVTFSRPVAEESLGAFSMTLAGKPVLGLLRLAAPTRLTFEPFQPLGFETEYQVRVDETLEAEDGTLLGEAKEWSFVTVERFLAPPVVDPPDGSEGVPTAIRLEARFFADLDALTIDESSFYLQDPDRRRLPGQVDYANRVATLEVPSEATFFGVEYTAVLTRDIQGIEHGERLEEDFTWSVRTEPLGPHRAIFINRNTTDNGIEALIERPDGEIVRHPSSPFRSGGDGGGDVLDGLAVSADGRQLYALSSLSRQLAAFRIGTSGGLEAISSSPFSNVGVPFAIESHPTLGRIYVASADSDGTRLQSWEIIAEGAVRPIGDPIPLVSGIPADITIRGNRLFLTYRTAPLVDVFGLANDGQPVFLTQNALPGFGSAGATLTADARYLFWLDESSNDQDLYAYFVGDSGDLTLVKDAPFDTSPGRGNRSGLVVRSDRKLYLGHGTPHITSYDLDGRGGVEQATNSTFVDSDLHPRRLFALDNGPSIYVLEEGPTQLRILDIGLTGDLEQIRTPVPIEGSNEPAGLVVIDRIGLSQDLVLHLPFDDSLHDVSGRNNHAQSLAEPVYAEGRIGNAFVFDGSDQFVALGLESDFQFGAQTDFTVSFWIRTSQTIGDSPFVSNKDWSSPNNIGWIIAAQGDSLHWQWSFRGDQSSRVDFDEAGTITDNIWHHLVVTHDRDGDAVFYQDGVRLFNTPIAGAGDIDSGLPLLIGQDGTALYDAPLLGLVDDFALWRRVLDASEVRRIYESGLAGESF
ncbi:MAG: Ig-like domain-containing protein [Planctomycetota bacterium]